MRACLIRRLGSLDSRKGHVWRRNSSRETQSDTQGWLPSPAASSGLQGLFFGIRGILGGTPCFLGSGDPDPHVPWERVKESASILSALGGKLTLKRYPGMPHTISSDEITEAKNILSPLRAERA